MNKFLTNKKFFSTHSALQEIFKSEGDYLILGYGYIGNQEEVIDEGLGELLNIINEELKKNQGLFVEIHLGLLVDWRKVDKSYIKKSLSSRDKFKFFYDVFKTQINDKFNQIGNFAFDEAVTRRIHIYGIPNFHAKYSLMVEDFNGFNPISGIMGSSNLTKSALFGKGRLELDLYMTGGEHNDLLCSFAKEIDEIRECNTGNKFAYWSFHNREFVVYESEEMMQYLEEVERREILHQAEKEWQLEDLVKSKYYLSSEEDKEALLDSDREQEISYGD